MSKQKTPDGKIIAIVGRSRSGKTAWLKKRIANSKRLLVWDIEGQYDDNMQIVTTKGELVAAIKLKEARISYQRPKNKDEFDYWAKSALVFAMLGSEQGLMSDIVAEEISDVTSPAKAPDGWGTLIRRGSKYGANIYGITQRPAESDKTLFGNCHEVHCCAMRRPADRKYMAEELDLSQAEIDGLNFKNLEFIHVDTYNDTKIKGRLTF